MHYVYILHSEKINKYYVGQTHDVDIRLERHNSDYYRNKWTAKGKPWTLATAIPCQSKQQAISIERHIKRMKSKKYIRNLLEYPEMREKLRERFPAD